MFFKRRTKILIYYQTLARLTLKIGFEGTTQNVIYSEYDEQFQAFGILVLILIITEVCILEAKNPILKNIRLFRRKK